MSEKLVKKVEEFISENHNRLGDAGHLLALNFQRVADIRALAKLGEEVLVDCGLKLLEYEASFEEIVRQKVLSGEGPKEGTNLC